MQHAKHIINSFNSKERETEREKEKDRQKDKERGELPAAEFEFVLTKSDQQDLKDPKDLCCRGQDYNY